MSLFVRIMNKRRNKKELIRRGWYRTMSGGYADGHGSFISKKELSEYADYELIKKYFPIN